MQFMKVPKGENAGAGVIICRGETHNLWKATEQFPADYPVLSEGEAYVEGLRMQPGTLMPEEVNTLHTEFREQYGIDIKSRLIHITRDKTVDLYTFLRDYTIRWPEGHPRRRDAFDIGGWID